MMRRRRARDQKGVRFWASQRVRFMEIVIPLRVGSGLDCLELLYDSCCECHATSLR